MAKQRDSNPTRSPDQTTSVFVHQLDRWKREAANHAYASLALKIFTSAGKVTRKQYLDAIINMEQQFPGLGWKPAADDLRNFYQTNQLELFKLPIMAQVNDVPIKKPREPGQEG